MRTRTGVAIGAAVLVASLNVIAAQSAPAQPTSVNVDQGRGVGACPSNRFCLYANYGYNNTSGLILKTDESIRNLGNYGFNDRASSIVNNTNSVVQVYWDYDFGGEWLTYYPGDRGDVPSRWNDVISSVRIR